MKREIKSIDNLFVIYLDGEYIGEYDNLIDAQDSLDDAYTEAMDGGHKYKCDFCQQWFNESEVQHQLEDSTFVAPYGEMIEWGGGVVVVPVCPVCGDTMEEC